MVNRTSVPDLGANQCVPSTGMGCDSSSIRSFVNEPFMEPEWFLAECERLLKQQ